MELLIIFITYLLSVAIRGTMHEPVLMQFSRKGVEQGPYFASSILPPYICEVILKHVIHCMFHISIHGPFPHDDHYCLHDI
jgi:hypothetical protein